MKKKLWFHLLAIVLIVVLAVGLSVNAFADEDTSGGTIEVEGLSASKHITVQDDGTYVIDLEAFSTGEVHTETVTVPADIILVLDVSGSMSQNINSYSYTARSSAAYSYSGYGNNTYFYLHSDGQYYQVTRQRTGNYNNYRYSLNVSINGTTYYLSGTGITTNRPTNVTGANNTIWTGVLYDRDTSSQSKLAALKTAVNGFIDEVALKNKEAVDAGATADNLSRIAIVKFAYNRIVNDYSQYQNYIGNQTYGNNNYNYTQVVADLDYVTQGDNATSWKSKVNALTASGATAADYGMGYAGAILDKHPLADGEQRSQVVVLFTDGEPNHQSGFDGTVANAAITSAKSMKDANVTVYSIAVYEGASTAEPPTTNINRYLHAISSNFPGATGYADNARGTRGQGNYYFVAENAEDLESIFKEIGQSSGSTTTPLSAESVMKDIVSSSSRRRTRRATSSSSGRR